MIWSGQQDAALKAVSKWARAKGGPQIYRLFGFAGTGKTTLARHIAEGIDGDVVFGAYTGKASLVLRSKGCAGAKTIHSLIYIPLEEGAGTGELQFQLNHDSAVASSDLVIIDECSMVDEALGLDLLSFGTKVLVLGDPAQLPPVRGAGYFTNQQPDAMLTEVHRQAADNPIIRMSMTVREGGALDPGAYGDSRVVTRHDIDAAQVVGSDQVLVGKNVTRRSYNTRIRTLKGFKDEMPATGDRLVCLKNNHRKGLLNGGLWDVAAMGRQTSQMVAMTLDSADGVQSKKAEMKVRVNRAFFRGAEGELAWSERKKSDEFDFGYALTVHKAQGSQWDNVMLFDESAAFRDERRRWLYTGLTRAAQRVTIVNM